jgi:hypothetical protein
MADLNALSCGTLNDAFAGDAAARQDGGEPEAGPMAEALGKTREE